MCVFVCMVTGRDWGIRAKETKCTVFHSRWKTNVISPTYMFGTRHSILKVASVREQTAASSPIWGCEAMFSAHVSSTVKECVRSTSLGLNHCTKKISFVLHQNSVSHEGFVFYGSWSFWNVTQTEHNTLQHTLKQLSLLLTGQQTLSRVRSTVLWKVNARAIQCMFFFLFALSALSVSEIVWSRWINNNKCTLSITMSVNNKQNLQRNKITVCIIAY